MKRLQDDETWRLLDGDTDVEVLLSEGGAGSRALAESDHNTARYIDGILTDAEAQVKSDIVNQFNGYDNTGWERFISDDGNINSEYINSQGKLVDSTDPLSNVKRLKICED